MRARNFSATTPFTNTPDRVASHTMPLRRTSERVLPCRSAVRIATAFSSADRYIATLNASGACFPWRDSPFVFLGRDICMKKTCPSSQYYIKDVCTPQEGLDKLSVSMCCHTIVILPVFSANIMLQKCPWLHMDSFLLERGAEVGCPPERKRNEIHAIDIISENM